MPQSVNLGNTAVCDMLCFSPAATVLNQAVTWKVSHRSQWRHRAKVSQSCTVLYWEYDTELWRWFYLYITFSSLYFLEARGRITVNVEACFLLHVYHMQQLLHIWMWSLYVQYVFQQLNLVHFSPSVLYSTVSQGSVGPISPTHKPFTHTLTPRG